MFKVGTKVRVITKEFEDGVYFGKTGVIASKEFSFDYRVNLDDGESILLDDFEVEEAIEEKVVTKYLPIENFGNLINKSYAEDIKRIRRMGSSLGIDTRIPYTASIQNEAFSNSENEWLLRSMASVYQKRPENQKTELWIV